MTPASKLRRMTWADVQRGDVVQFTRTVWNPTTGVVEVVRSRGIATAHSAGTYPFGLGIRGTFLSVPEDYAGEGFMWNSSDEPGNVTNHTFPYHRNGDEWSAYQYPYGRLDSRGRNNAPTRIYLVCRADCADAR